METNYEISESLFMESTLKTLSQHQIIQILNKLDEIKAIMEHTANLIKDDPDTRPNKFPKE